MLQKWVMSGGLRITKTAMRKRHNVFAGAIPETCRSRDSALCIATSYGLDGRGGRSSSPGRRKIFPLDVFHADSGAQSTSYPVVTGGPFPLDEATRA
jgi:hypothetical protein